MEDFKEIKPIQFADSNTFGALNPLVSFNCLIDTDFGLLVLIAQKFFDTSVFNKDFFDKYDNINDMKNIVYTREERNPLILCMNNIDNADEYYQEFFDQYYKDILQKSMITDFGKSLDKLSSAGAIFTILCNKQEEIDLLESIDIFKKYSKLLLGKDDIGDHNQYFFKYYSDINVQLINSNLIDKHIYVARYNFTEFDNLNEKELSIYSIIDSMRNLITRFDLYTNIERN